MTTTPAPNVSFRPRSMTTPATSEAPAATITEAVTNAAESAAAPEARQWKRLSREAYLALSQEERKAYTAWSRSQGGGMRGARGHAAQRNPRMVAKDALENVNAQLATLFRLFNTFKDRPERTVLLESCAEAADWVRGATEELAKIPADYAPPAPVVAVGSTVLLNKSGQSRWAALFDGESLDAMKFTVTHAKDGKFFIKNEAGVVLAASATEVVLA